MRPNADVQVRWGLATSATALVAVGVLAFAPDPLFRQRVLVTSVDNVDGVTDGTPVYFRGAPMGAVRSVRLDPQTRTFAVAMGVAREWRPSACVFTQVSAPNPFTTPRVELVALEVAPTSCAMARAVSHCQVVTPALDARGGAGVVGCQRRPDLVETASLAVAEAGEAAKSVNLIVQHLQGAMQATGGGKFDLPGLVNNATTTMASVNDLTRKLDQSLTPGKGDVAVALGNFRRASDRAASVDIASLNATLVQLRTLVSENQAHVTAMLSRGSQITDQTHVLLQNLSGSLSETSDNLKRTTDNLDALTERLAADPSYVVRGQKFADPPKVVSP